MKTVEFSASKITFDDGATMLCLEEDDCFEFYLKKPGYTYEFMFGVPVEQQSKQEAIDVAIANVPDYLDMLFDEE